MNTATATTGRTYAIDPVHTTVEFVVRHLMITKVRGRFTGVSGTIVVPDGSDVPSDIDVKIDALVDRHARRSARQPPAL